MPAELPVDACIGQRELSEPRLTPRGDAVVHTVAQAGETALVVQRLAADASPLGPARVLPTVPAPRVGRGLGGGCWCYVRDDREPDGVVVVYAGADGDLWAQPLDGRPSRRLTAHGPERTAQAPSASPDGRWVVHVVDQAEVWAVDVAAGAMHRLDAGSADFCFDPAVVPRGGDHPGLAVWQAWDVPDMPWDASRVEVAPLPGGAGRATGLTVPRPAHAVQQVRPLPDGRLGTIRDDTGWLNVWVGDVPVVDEPYEHAGPTWGLGQRTWAASPDGAWIAFTRNERGFGRLCVAELATGRVVEVDRGVHGQLSWEGTRLAALRTGARTPTAVVVHDLTDPSAPGTRTTVAVGPTWPWDRDALVEPELLEVATADGGVVPARWYPAAREAGRPARVICWLHGGPTDQWQVTFLPRIEYWRSRGWDIVVPDHRGSTGHGRAHQQALAGRWGELDVADTAAVLRAVHAAGRATPARTVLMGGSAGGFTVLGTLAAHPELAAAAMVAYPVTDLGGLAERSHRFERHATWRLVGRPGEDEEVERRYRERSPAWFAPRIVTPLLVVHGADDPVVPVAQSRVLVERIRAARGAGAHVELVVYPGEGHGIRLREHQRDEFERTAAFLEHHVPVTPGPG